MVRSMLAAMLLICVLGIPFALSAEEMPPLAHIDFAKPLPDYVDYSSKHWNVRDGAIEAKNTGGGYQWVTVGRDGWKVGEVTFQVKLVERLPEKDAFAAFKIRGIGVRLRGWGANQVLYWDPEMFARKKFPKPVIRPLPSNVWFDVRMVITHELTTFYLNGEKLFDLPNPPPESFAGPVKLGRYRAHVAYRNITVKPFSDESRPRYNYAVNGSFEYATNKGVPDYWTDVKALTGLNKSRWLSEEGNRQWYRSWRQTDENPFHGAFAMRIEYPLALVSRAFQVRKGKGYVVSAYLRADSDGLPVEFIAADRMAKKPNAVAKLTVNRQWKRYSLAVDQFDALAMYVSLKPLEKGAIWVDAVKIEEGETPSAYTPSSRDEIFKLIGKPVTANPPLPPDGNLPPLGMCARRVTADAVNADGKLDDPAWKNAQWQTLCTTSGTPAAVETRVAAAYDQQNIYLAVQCAEPNPKDMATSAVKHDFPVWSHESLEVFVSHVPDGSTYCQLALNASGSRADMKRDANGMHWDWNGDWSAACKIGPDHWTAEVVIPFATITDTPAVRPGSTWRLNVCRNRPSAGQLFNWSPTSGSFHDTSRFGYLRFGEGSLPHLMVGVDGARLVSVTDGRTELAARVINRTDKALTAVVSGQVGKKETGSIRIKLAPKATVDFSLAGAGDDKQAAAVITVDLGADTGAFTWTGKVERQPALDMYTERNYYTNESIARIIIENRLAADTPVEISIGAADTKSVKADAPVGGRVAVKLPVTQLAPGEYTVTCRAKGLAKPFKTVLRKLPAAAKLVEVKVDRLRRVILVDGEPYFPYGVYFLCILDRPALERYRAEGFDFIHYGAVRWLNQDQMRESVKTASDLGIRSMIFYPVHPTRPREMERWGAAHAQDIFTRYGDIKNVIGYIPADEVGRNLDPVYNWVDQLNKLDPYRLAFPNHNLAGHRIFRNARGLPGDALSMDRYPIWPKPNDPRTTEEIYTLELAAVEVERDAVKLRKPIFHFLQNYGASREPTPREQEWMHYITVIHGCRGIYFYFNQPRSVDHWNRIKELREEMKTLLPVLIEPDDVKGILSTPENFAAVLAKKHDGALYLITLNRARRPVDISFNLSKVYPSGTKAEVLFENRTVQIKGNVLRDRFDTLERHVYKIR